jgi:hypothetical protein
MEQVLRLIADYQWWIYGVLGLVLLFYLRRALVARRDGARSIFALEQEQARLRYTRSVMAAAVVIAVLAMVFVVSNPVILPSTATSTPSPTATVTAGPLPVSTLTATPPAATATLTPSPTMTRPPRPVMPTASPAVVVTPTPVVRPPSCPDPNVRITSPGVNQVVSGNTSIRGTAMHDSFQYYKIEIGVGNDPQNWSVVGQLHYNMVNNGVLATLNGGGYAPGRYTLRLVVVDQTGNYPPPCQVTIDLRR